MICKSIEEYTLRYLENESGTQERRRLLKHLISCDRCRKMFDLIRANYHTDENASEAQIHLSEKIGVMIDKSRYPDRMVHPRQFSLKKVFVVTIALVLLIFTVANADTIFKTYKELKNAMFVDQRLVNISGLKHTGIYSDESYVKSVYEKYEDAVQAKIDRMDIAENAILTFNEDGEEFNVQIAKGVNGNFIRYGFNGYIRFENDFSRDLSMRIYENILNSPAQFDSIEELLNSAGFAPVPGYIPDGFSLFHARQSSSGKGRTIPESIMLSYQNSAGDSLSISLTRSKMVADGIGIPDELANAANLPETAGDTAVAQNIMEELIIGEYQAVYTERPVYSAAMDGTYKTYKTISMYLGDAAKLPILRIESAAVDKETLLKVASMVEIHNSGKNLVDAGGYFKGIKDEKIMHYTGKFLEKVKAGQLEFRLKVDDNTEFYRYSHNDTYYILYRNVPLNQYESMIPLSISLDEGILKKVEYATVQILGWPYSDEKSYSLNFIRNKNTSIGISIDRPVRLPDGIELTDFIISRMSGSQNEVNPLFSHSGHLYYLYDSSRSWILNTVYEENRVARNYTFIIDKEILKNIREIIDFINSL